MTPEQRAATDKAAKAPGTAAAQGPVAANAAAAKVEAEKKAPTVVTVTKLTPAQKKAVTIDVAKKLGPEVAEMSRSMFGTMAEQSTEFYENMTTVSAVFWETLLPDMAEIAWLTVTDRFIKKLDQIAGPAMIPIAFETGGGGGGAGGGAGGGMGGMAAAVGQDGSITIKMMIPRDAIDASNRMAHGYGS